MGELVELHSSSQENGRQTLVISPPPLQLTCPSIDLAADKTYKRPFVKVLMTPVGGPVKKEIASIRGYLKEVRRRLTEVETQDEWLPITESRNGNAYYAAFHTLSSGIGFQAFALPLAFTTLGGKIGKLLALFPLLYLSGGTCITQIIIGGRILNIFFLSVCGETCSLKPLSVVEWYVVFTCLAIILAQLPNLNSLAVVSLVGAITAVQFNMDRLVSIIKGRAQSLSHDPPEAKSEAAGLFTIFNALGIIAFAFRGHNLVLEIQIYMLSSLLSPEQGTMPSRGNLKHPSRLPMWRGVKLACLIVAACLFPLAITGYWVYGNLMPDENGGILTALYTYYKHDTSKLDLGIGSLLVVVNCLSSFPIYAMPIFDNWEFIFSKICEGPCPWWLRTGIRIMFGCVVFFIAVALPFLPSLVGLLGGIALRVTLAYPCLMWVIIKKPKGWCPNWAFGVLGMALSILVITGAIWVIVTKGIPIHFFKPQQALETQGPHDGETNLI